MKALNLITAACALIAAAGAVEGSYRDGMLGEALSAPEKPSYQQQVAAAFNLAPEDGGPRLVAYGCEGSAGGPLWARNEDDFPTMCKEIIGEIGHD